MRIARTLVVAAAIASLLMTAIFYFVPFSGSDKFSGSQTGSTATEMYDVYPDDMPPTILADSDDKVQGAKLTERGHELIVSCPDGMDTIPLHGGDTVSHTGMVIDVDEQRYPPSSGNANDQDDISLTFTNVGSLWSPQLLIIGNRAATTLDSPTVFYDDQGVSLSHYRIHEGGTIILSTRSFADHGYIYPKALCLMPVV